MVIGTGGPAWSQDKKHPKPVVLFSVGDKPVYTEEFVHLYRKNHLKKEDFTAEKINQYLDLFVNFKLKVAEAHARGLDTTSAFRKEFATYKQELKKPYLVRKDDLTRLTQEAYDRLKEEVKASHILILVKPDASAADTLAAWKKINGLREQVLKGEDFETLARDFSEDPSAKSNGGNLGYFTALQMVYPFENAAYHMKPGEISNPFRTRFGYHILKVSDRMPARGEVEVSHILLRANDPKDAKIKNKAFDIFDQLQGGRNWDELVKEYSDDPSTKDSGGRLRPFGVGTFAAVPEFEKVAFTLKQPGEISDPFQSAVGWHIIRLEKKLPVPPYSEVEGPLKRRISRDERMQLADKRQLEEKKKERGFVENDETKRLLFASVDSTLLAGTWRFKGDASLKEKPLFTLQNRVIPAKEAIQFIESTQTVSGVSLPVRVNELYDAFVGEKIGENEDVELMEKNSEYRNLLTEYREGILLFTVMEKEVWNRDLEDTVALRKFYDSTKETYKAGERVHARVFSTDKNTFDQISKRLAANDSLRKEDARKLKVAHGWHNFEHGESKAVDKAVWSIGLHTVEIDNNYFLVEIDNLVPPGLKNFQEARTQVTSAYQEQMEKKWLKELRAKYPVKINSKGQKAALKELLSQDK